MLKLIRWKKVSRFVCMLGMLAYSMHGHALTYNIHFHRESFEGGYMDLRGFTISTLKQSHFCVYDVMPSYRGFVADKPDASVDMAIHYKSAFLSECEFKHSHQYFSISLSNNSAYQASFEWYKKPVVDATIKNIKDPHHIIHLHRLKNDRNRVDYHNVYIGRGWPEPEKGKLGNR